MNQIPNQANNGASKETSVLAVKRQTGSRRQPVRLAIGVHSMPKTSAGNLRLWFVLGGVILVLFAVIIFLTLN